MKKFLSIFLILLMLLANGAAYAYNTELVVDEAALISDSQEQILEERLADISNKYDTAVAIVTVLDTGGIWAESFAESYFKENDYARGAAQNGILLLIAIESRDWSIYTSGLGYDAFYDRGIDAFEEDAVSYLSVGNYASAFNIFADLCESYLKDETTIPWMRNILISLGIGIVIALIVVTVMKGKLKSVRAKSHAGDYTKSGSFALRQQRDTFLYVTRHRTPRPKDNGGSGRRSGGGRSGGRGGKF